MNEIQTNIRRKRRIVLCFVDPFSFQIQYNLTTQTNETYNCEKLILPNNYHECFHIIYIDCTVFYDS